MFILHSFTFACHESLQKSLRMKCLWGVYFVFSGVCLCFIFFLPVLLLHSDIRRCRLICFSLLSSPLKLMLSSSCPSEIKSSLLLSLQPFPSREPASIRNPLDFFFNCFHSSSNIIYSVSSSSSVPHSDFNRWLLNIMITCNLHSCSVISIKLPHPERAWPLLESPLSLISLWVNLTEHYWYYIGHLFSPSLNLLPVPLWL